eukprot:11192010-Lingulodinium_polyedra.AAC.1
MSVCAIRAICVIHAKFMQRVSFMRKSRQLHANATQRTGRPPPQRLANRTRARSTRATKLARAWTARACDARTAAAAN